MPAEVRLLSYPSVVLVLMISRVHMWFLWICGNSRCNARKSLASNRRQILQSSFQTARQQLDTAEERNGRCSYLARVVCRTFLLRPVARAELSLGLQSRRKAAKSLALIRLSSVRPRRGNSKSHSGRRAAPPLLESRIT
jgi:hypothetical protein